MADPRLNIAFQGITGPEALFGADASIDLPVFSNGQNLSVSKSLSTAVTVTSTSTYSAVSETGITVGYGVSGQRILGQVLTVAPEGFVTVQVRGFCIFPVLSTNQPQNGHLVGVDGAGNVIGVPDTTALCANAVCVGYVYNHNQEQFSHLSGNIVPPSATVNGPTSALVFLG